VDLVEPPEIPDKFMFVRGDVLGFRFSSGLGLWEMYGRHLVIENCQVRRGKETSYNVFGKFDFICASSPCEQFSTLRNFRPPVPYPEEGVKLFNHTRAICEASGVPYVMENVAGAGRFVGRAVSHCGSYYLWGTGVPPILPQNIRKGMTELAMGLREHKGKPGWNARHGQKGKTPTARVATIPPELANCVADYAERLRNQVTENEIVK
jgi:hypothetical protein